jgi:hypothetical protein
VKGSHLEICHTSYAHDWQEYNAIETPARLELQTRTR